MASNSFAQSAPVKLLLRLLLTMLLLFVMNKLLDQYFFLDGGLIAYVILGSLITLLNVIIRPILHIALLPLAFFMGPILVIVVNAGFLWLIEKVVAKLDPNLITLQVDQSWFGWLVIAVTLGLGNWVIKEVV